MSLIPLGTRGRPSFLKLMAKRLRQRSVRARVAWTWKPSVPPAFRRPLVTVKPRPDPEGGRTEFKIAFLTCSGVERGERRAPDQLHLRRRGAEIDVH